MKSKATIRISSATSDRLGRVPDGELSARIAAIIARYEQMVRFAMPTFTRSQWLAIFDANNYTDTFADEAIPSGMVIRNLADHPSTGQRWGIDKNELVNEMGDLRPEQLLTIREACVRFWQANELPTPQALSESGANVADQFTLQVRLGVLDGCDEIAAASFDEFRDRLADVLPDATAWESKAGIAVAIPAKIIFAKEEFINASNAIRKAGATVVRGVTCKKDGKFMSFVPRTEQL